MHRWILAGFVGLLLLLVAGALVAIQSMRTVIRNDQLVADTHQVQQTIEGMLAAVADVETAQRAYLLTEDDAFLAQFEEAKAKIPARQKRLAELASDNPRRQRRVAALTPLVAARLKILDDILAVSREQGSAAARQAIQAGDGAKTMQQIRDLLADMQMEEDRLLRTRARESRESARRLAAVLELTTILVAAAVIGVFWLYKRDVLQRQRGEEARSRLSLLVASANDAILSKDMSGTITSWNAGAEKLFGYPAAEAIGQNVSIIVPPDRMAEEAEFIAALQRGDRVERHETVRRDRAGRLIPVSVTISPLVDASGRTIEASTIARDITDRKQAEAELLRARDELEQRVIERTADLEAANKELEAFSYSVSHDLRAPLRGIDGFSRILLEDFGPQLPAECQEYLRDVRSATQQMGRLVDDLLAFSRLGRQPMRRQTVEPERLVAQVMEELAGETAGRQIELRIAKLAPCAGDPALLKQVWMNLLSNAVKYTRARAVATIEIGSQEGGEAGERTYYVKDNGVGFDMRYADKLFGVFQRLHRAEDYAGTGVGLAIVQRIVHRHGGRVWADSRVDGGAAFFFTCPASEATDA